MIRVRPRKWPWIAPAVAVAMAAGGVFLQPPPSPFEDIGFLLVVTSMAVVGALILSRLPGHRIGWIFLGLGVAPPVGLFAQSYAHYALVTRPGSLPGAVPLSIISGFWFPLFFTLVTFLFLLFPNGRLLSTRWRWVGRLALAPFLLGMLYIFYPGGLDFGNLPVENPLGIEGTERFFAVFFNVWFLLITPPVVAGVVSMVVRFRRAVGDERQQLKWFGYGAIFFGLVVIVDFILLDSILGIDSGVAGDLISIVSLLAIPVSAVIAILRYRLYDIDIVINKTVVYGGLAVFITAVYLGMVAGIGALIGSRGNLLLSILATALIALAFQPVRERVQRFANKLVYGERMSPYEAMADLSHQMAGAISLDEVLPRLARTAAEGVGATRSRVTVFLPDGEERSTGWPQNEALDTWDRTVPVVHQQENIGEIAVAKPPGDSLTSAEEKLLADLASQAGLALRNVRLTEDLRASRRRIVNAQDEERKRMERDIHDGAQQQLVSLAVKLSLAENLFEKDPSRTAEMLRSLRTEVNDVVESVRDLARGIYPPLLSQAGVAAALKADVNKLGIDAEIKAADGNQRFEPQVEAAVYFCIREALQNASKHAAGRATVDLWFHDRTVGFSVTDRGPGFDTATAGRGAGLQNMIDRLEAIGGTLEIRSAPGEGTTVAGRVPASGFRSF